MGTRVDELYRLEALGIISGREFDKRIDDAYFEDLEESRAEEERDYSGEYDEYVKGMLAEMSFHDLKMNGVNRDGTQRYRRLIDMKGRHTHNHVLNAELRTKFRSKNERFKAKY